MASNPEFPILIQVGRAGATQAAWETLDKQSAERRIEQLEADGTVTWFHAYEIRSFRTIGVKKTIVMVERPNTEGEVD